MKILIKGLIIGFSTNCKRWLTLEEYKRELSVMYPVLPQETINLWIKPVKSHNGQGFFCHVRFDC